MIRRTSLVLVPRLTVETELSSSVCAGFPPRTDDDREREAPMGFVIDVNGETRDARRVSFSELRIGDYWQARSGQTYRVEDVRRYGELGAVVSCAGIGSASVFPDTCAGYWRVLFDGGWETFVSPDISEPLAIRNVETGEIMLAEEGVRTYVLWCEQCGCHIGLDEDGNVIAVPEAHETFTREHKGGSEETPVPWQTCARVDVIHRCEHEGGS